MPRGRGQDWESWRRQWRRELRRRRVGRWRAAWGGLVVAYVASHSATGTDQVVLNRVDTADGQKITYWIESYGETVTWGFTPEATGSVTVSGGGSGRPSTWSYATRIAASEPATRTITIGGGNGATVKGMVVANDNRSAAAPTIQETDVAGDSASPVTAALAGLTAAAGDDLIGLYAIAATNTAGSWVLTPPAGFTLRQTVNGSGSVFTGGAIAIVTLDNHGGGATGTQTGT